MKLAQYLDSTYLKTPIQAGISEQETKQNVIKLVEEAISLNFKLVMIRAKYISLAKTMISNSNSNVLTGTVIGFHEGSDWRMSGKRSNCQVELNTLAL